MSDGNAPVLLFSRGFEAGFEAVPHPGDFSVFALWGTSLSTQGLVLPSTGAPQLATRAGPHLGGQGHLPPLPAVLTGVLSSASRGIDPAVSAGIFGAFFHRSCFLTESITSWKCPLHTKGAFPQPRQGSEVLRARDVGFCRRTSPKSSINPQTYALLHWIWGFWHREEEK